MIALKKTVWRPLLEGAGATRALDAVEAIAADILGLQANQRAGRSTRAAKRMPRDASIASGTAGLAVFFGYLSRAGFGSRYEQAARPFLEGAGEAVGSVTMAPTFYGGFVGVAWAFSHLERQLFGTTEGGAADAVDEVLKKYVHRRGWKADYDLVAGLVGLGVYALERLPAPAAVACTERIVDRLEETSRRGSDGISWHTAPELLPPWQRKLCPSGYYNLGLAHGVPGVIALLGAAWAAGIRRKTTRRLLDGAVAWLLSQKRRRRTGSQFSAWIAPGVPDEDCRSAWCYGDPGAAAALLVAARCAGEPAWEREALKIARAAARRPTIESGVLDAGICHGAAGLAHLFNRLHQTAGDATLRRAALFWFQRTIAMRQPGRGIGGFRALAAHEDGTKHWNDDDSGILTGAAGIGLALLAAATPIEPEWDRMLLTSVRKVGRS